MEESLLRQPFRYDRSGLDFHCSIRCPLGHLYLYSRKPVGEEINKEAPRITAALPFVMRNLFYFTIPLTIFLPA